MNKIYSLIFVLVPLFSFSQNEFSWNGGIYLTSDIPIRSQMPKMSTSFGGGFQLAFKPIRRLPLFLEFKGGYGQYSNLTSEQTFIFDDGSTTRTDVRYQSYMNRIQFGMKYYYTSFYKPVRGYVTPQIGYTFMRSGIRIEDPLDEDDCLPLETRVSHRASGWHYGLEAGLEIDIVGLIRGDDYSKSRLYISASYLGSFKKIDYINPRYMHENEHHVFDNGNGHFVDEEGRALTTQFINLSSNDIHEHKIAEIYRTHLRYININIGYVWYF